MRSRLVLHGLGSQSATGANEIYRLQRMSFIRSGSVFVWEESDDDTGLRRWTDGLLWSASRMREVCSN